MMLLPKEAPLMPRRARCTVPYCFRSATTLVMMLVGIAKPYPAYAPVGEDNTELIPTSSPFAFTSAPPLFPWLIAASVWMKDSIPPLYTPRVRALALTIPAVTVEFRLKGFPTASTHSPTFSVSESPTGIVGRSSSDSILIRARSVLGSVPITRPLNSRLSFSFTLISSAPSIT